MSVGLFALNTNDHYSEQYVTCPFIRALTRLAPPTLLPASWQPNN